MCSAHTLSGCFSCVCRLVLAMQTRFGFNILPSQSEFGVHVLFSFLIRWSSISIVFCTETKTSRPTKNTFYFEMTRETSARTSAHTIARMLMATRMWTCKITCFFFTLLAVCFEKFHFFTCKNRKMDKKTEWKSESLKNSLIGITFHSFPMFVTLRTTDKKVKDVCVCVCLVGWCCNLKRSRKMLHNSHICMLLSE